MAISKTQPMRPAEIELVDTVNSQTVTLATHAQAIADLSAGLEGEIDARSQADTALGDRIADEAIQRAAGDSAIEAIIGDGFTASNTIADSLSATNQQVSSLSDDLSDVEGTVTDIQSDVEGLLAFEGRMKIGSVEGIVIPANDSISASETFAQPFDSGSACIVLAQVITSELPTLFALTISNCTYSGFSYSVANSDTDAHTISLGYVAVRTSA